ncbi:radical SAM/SPASM domain-containing protein [Azospirillum doebereinerae]
MTSHDVPITGPVKNAPSQSGTSIAERRKRQYFDMSENDLLTPVPPFPKKVMLELSNGCNHACLFCANPHMQRQVGRMEPDLALRLIAEAYEAGAEEIGFYTTGEPFVHRELARFTAEASRLGYRYIFMNTNGALATPERAKPVLDAGVHSIKFSINAGSRETYRSVHGKDDFNAVMANLESISRYRSEKSLALWLAVSMVVTRPVAHEVDELRARVMPFVDEFITFECGSQVSQMSAAEQLLAVGKEDPRHQAVCSQPFTVLYLTQEGYLNLCCIDYHNYLAVADARMRPLKDVWLAPEFQDIRSRHLNGTLAGTLCGACWQGCRETSKPLRPEFATVIDKKAFDDHVEALIRRRLPDL